MNIDEGGSALYHTLIY